MIKHFALSAILATALLAIGSPAQAVPVAFNNASFENQPFPDGGFAFGTPAGWTLVGGANPGVLNPTAAAFPGGADNGENALFGTNAFLLGQVTNAIIDDGDTFTLTVALGNRADVGGQDMQIHLAAADGTILASSAILGNADIAAGTFQDVTVAFTANAGTAGLGAGVQILLEGFGGGGQSIFDNVRLDEAAAGVPPVGVPEPATMSLLGAGVIGAFSLRRRRKQI